MIVRLYFYIFRTKTTIANICSNLPEGKYAARFERDLKRFKEDLKEGKGPKMRLLEVNLILDTACVRKYREMGQTGDIVAMKMIEAINAKNLIRLRMMDFMTTVVILEQWRQGR